jgi:DNA-binding Lrp family transcriptional regulator
MLTQFKNAETIARIFAVLENGPLPFTEMVEKLPFISPQVLANIRRDLCEKGYLVKMGKQRYCHIYGLTDKAVAELPRKDDYFGKMDDVYVPIMKVKRVYETRGFVSTVYSKSL